MLFANVPLQGAERCGRGLYFCLARYAGAGAPDVDFLCRLCGCEYQPCIGFGDHLRNELFRLHSRGVPGWNRRSGKRADGGGNGHGLHKGQNIFLHCAASGCPADSAGL